MIYSIYILYMFLPQKKTHFPKKYVDMKKNMLEKKYRYVKKIC